MLQPVDKQFREIDQIRALLRATSLPSRGAVLATDLDGTLFANGDLETCPADDAMPLLKRVLSEGQMQLIYATGRRFEQALSGAAAHSAPSAGYVICDVGSKIYRQEENGAYIEDENYFNSIKVPGWTLKGLKNCLSGFKQLELQEPEKQNEVRLCYYVRNTSVPLMIALARAVQERVEGVCAGLHTIPTYDETVGIGYLEVMPASVSKQGALEYLIKKGHIKRESILFSGDAGNDDQALSSGRVKAVLVNNASRQYKEHLRLKVHSEGITDLVHFAAGLPGAGLNGNYVSGILEGLVRFGAVDEEALRRR